VPVAPMVAVRLPRSIFAVWNCVTAELALDLRTKINADAARRIISKMIHSVLFFLKNIRIVFLREGLLRQP